MTLANPDHLKILDQGVKAWNQWRQKHLDVSPDLMRANLSRRNLRVANLHRADLENADMEGAMLGQLAPPALARGRMKPADLSEADLTDANLQQADLTRVNLFEAKLHRTDLRGAFLFGANLSRASLSGAFMDHADLRGADLSKANLAKAQLSGADLRGAKLPGANLFGANLVEAKLGQSNLEAVDLTEADLSHASLHEADLSRAILVNTNLSEASLNGARIYGIAAWNINLEKATQEGLIITPRDEPGITVDDVAVAQFIYLLMKNERIKEVIDTITSKAVLILGSFSAERKAVLDAIREELRHRNFTPIMFDFDKPASKDLTGTVETLARMARFIIADLTDPSSIPHELATIVPFLRTTPVLLIRLEGSSGYGMVKDLLRYNWVLPPHEYKDSKSLIATLPEVIEPADKMAEDFRKQ